jgi:hypothetical protein
MAAFHLRIVSARDPYSHLSFSDRLQLLAFEAELAYLPRSLIAAAWEAFDIRTMSWKPSDTTDREVRAGMKAKGWEVTSTNYNSDRRVYGWDQRAAAVRGAAGLPVSAVLLPPADLGPAPLRPPRGSQGSGAPGPHAGRAQGSQRRALAAGARPGGGAVGTAGEGRLRLPVCRQRVAACRSRAAAVRNGGSGGARAAHGRAEIVSGGPPPAPRFYPPLISIKTWRYIRSPFWSFSLT